MATSILQLLSGSLNFAACANLVPKITSQKNVIVLNNKKGLPGGKPPYITATSFPMLSILRDTEYMSFLLKHTIQSPGCTLSKLPANKIVHLTS